MSLPKVLTFTFFMVITSLSSAQTFTFTAIPDEDESRLVERFSRIAEHLQAELGVEVDYIPVKSYAAAVTAFRNSQVQLAWFGGLSGVQARSQVTGSKAIAQGYEDQFFKTYFIAHHTTGLEKSATLPAALQGKIFTFGSKGSTSGRLMPEYYIREAFNSEPREVFERVGFSGDHSRTIAQVQAGAYQVGAVNYLVWQKKLQAGEIDLNKVKVIWETPTYPDYQWTIRGDVDKRFGAGFSEKVKHALLNIKDEKLLAAFPRKSFVPTSNNAYLPIETTARKIKLLQ